jgi:mono/diheme cytochrome c family protein
MIRASCHTADNAFALEFDATPWFREVDPQTLVHLAAQGWSSVWIADALEMRPGYVDLHQLVSYAATRLREESLEDPTWAVIECVVSQPDATQWLGENRPEIALMLQCR